MTNANTVFVSTGQVDDLVSQIQELASKMHNAFEEANNIVSAVKGSWTGEASDGYVKCFESLKKCSDSAIQEIVSYCELMYDGSELYSKTESSLLSVNSSFLK